MSEFSVISARRNSLNFRKAARLMGEMPSAEALLPRMTNTQSHTEGVGNPPPYLNLR
jgi:hypothetical protein